MGALYPQLILLGDSLIQRTVVHHEDYAFQAELQAKCIRRLDVINRGFSGWNTANVRKYFEEIFPKPCNVSAKIDYLVILLGANDAVLPLPGTWQHVPLEEYGDNLSAIIAHPHIQAHNPKIILVTPPPLDEIQEAEEDKNEGFPEPIRRAAVTMQYAQKARDVAAKHENVILIDLWQALMDKAIEMVPDDYEKGGPLPGTPENGKRAGLQLLLPDGLHMSGQAYRVFYKLLAPHIGTEWENLPENDRSGYLFPDWREFGPSQSKLDDQECGHN